MMGFVIAGIVGVFAVMYFLTGKCFLCSLFSSNTPPDPQSMAGLIYNPMQDVTSIQGSTQMTVDPLTGELTMQPSLVYQSQSSYSPANPISGTATGTVSSAAPSVPSVSSQSVST